MKNALLISALLVFLVQLTSHVVAQKSGEENWNIQNHVSKASFRGVFVTDDKTAWISGSNGTVLRTTDGGQTIESVGPNDADELDFRDVHAFDENNAVLLTAGQPARAYRTSDGGKTWKIAFEHPRKEAFFDAMSFWDKDNGIAFSDPIDGKVVIIRTEDGGHSWKELDRNIQPFALKGEGGFAASGTCLCVQGNRVFIGLGGERKNGELANARILRSEDRGLTWQAMETPLKSGEASGIFSIVFFDESRGVAVGGTYNSPEDAANNICITEDGGESWLRPASTPRGYRSCVAIQKMPSGSRRLLAVSRAGSDVSNDWGESWQRFDDETFYALSFDETGNFGVAVGADGKIGILKRKAR